MNWSTWALHLPWLTQQDVLACFVFVPALVAWPVLIARRKGLRVTVDAKDQAVVRIATDGRTL